MLLEELARELEHIALMHVCGVRNMSDVKRVIQRLGRCLSIAAARHGGADDGIEKGQAVLIRHLEVEGGGSPWAGLRRCCFTRRGCGVYTSCVPLW